MKLSHKFNCIRINPENTIEHEWNKFTTAYTLIKQGHKIATECVSANGKRRYDIIDFDTGDVWEIETGKSYEKNDGSIRVKI